MRIAFLGKGGSGKTSISSAFIKYVSKIEKPDNLIAIDADVNVHLRRALGIDKEPVWLGKNIAAVKEYVRGKRTDLTSTFVPTTPPSLGSNFIKNSKDDPFLKQYGLQNDNISLLTIGTFETEDVGHSCYHGKLNTLEVILHHTLDREDDYVVADVMAGIDNLGTSLFMAYDANIFVVEPTQKSIQVYSDFKRASEPYHLNTFAIMNKVEDAKDEAFIMKHIPREEIIATFKYDRALKDFEQGDINGLDRFMEDNKAQFKKIILATKNVKRDWKQYYRLLLDVHKKNSIEWWNDFYGEPIDSQLDPDFSYVKVL